MIVPVLKDEALLADIRDTDPGNGVALWWLGQSGFLMKSHVGTVLFDPYLSDSLTHKYAATDKPHVRMTELALAPGSLTGIDVVTSSHNHTDHLDAETLLPVFSANPGVAFVIPEANRAFVAERLGCEATWPIGMADGEQRTIRNMTVHGVPAAHDEVERDEEGRPKYMGYVVDVGGITIYHSGDTRYFPEMTDMLKRFHIDIALLPINGHRPERRVAGNLFGDEAARLAKDIGAGI
ncbi:MAG: MBL fold metallo-hydrolase, partial [Planctomycetales bacterium]|nr:MBL fold metallo-hydrolase [Planctomycetales bacterium]